MCNRGLWLRRPRECDKREIMAAIWVWSSTKAVSITGLRFFGRPYLIAWSTCTNPLGRCWCLHVKIGPRLCSILSSSTPVVQRTGNNAMLSGKNSHTRREVQVQESTASTSTISMSILLSHPRGSYRRAQTSIDSVSAHKTFQGYTSLNKNAKQQKA